MMPSHFDPSESSYGQVPPCTRPPHRVDPCSRSDNRDADANDPSLAYPRLSASDPHRQRLWTEGRNVRHDRMINGSKDSRVLTARPRT